MEAILGGWPGLPVAVFRQGDRPVLEIEPAEAVFVPIEGTVVIVRSGTALMSLRAPRRAHRRDAGAARQALFGSCPGARLARVAAIRSHAVRYNPLISHVREARNRFPLSSDMLQATACRVDDPGRFLAERPVLPLSAARLIARGCDNATACLCDLKPRTGDRGSDGFGRIDKVPGSLLTQSRPAHSGERRPPAVCRAPAMPPDGSRGRRRRRGLRRSRCEARRGRRARRRSRAGRRWPGPPRPARSCG